MKPLPNAEKRIINGKEKKKETARLWPRVPKRAGTFREGTMDIQEAQKLYPVEVDSRNQAAIACPRCQFVKIVEAGRFRSSGNRINVRCRCGHVFRCQVNFRRHFRKPVRLAGEYRNVKTGKRGDMLIEDLSLGGVGFTRFGPHQVQLGDRLEVRFRLSRKSGREIAKRAWVRSIRDDFVGLEFSETDLPGKDLQFFLMDARPAAGA
jgi:hypothetical protein